MNLETVIKNLAIKANIELRKDVLNLLREAFYREKSPLAKGALKVILENAKIARKEKIAICQDTGLPLVFLEVGRDIKIDKTLLDRIKKGVNKAYREGGFRASVIDSQGKLTYSGNFFHIEFTNTKGVKVTIFPKGFGSENKTKMKMFNPTASYDDINKFILEAVEEAGPGACPPFFVGIGIGSTSEGCLVLAKKALLFRLDKPTPSKELAKWEKILKEKINALGIGPMGLGGCFSCLAVKIKRSPTHIAGLPVGVNISCHALRSATISISKDKLMNLLKE